jgi:hypothetical protein
VGEHAARGDRRAGPMQHAFPVHIGRTCAIS